MVQLLEQADLPELDARYAVIWVLDLDLLDCDSLNKHINDRITNDDINSNCATILSTRCTLIEQFDLSKVC